MQCTWEIVKFRVNWFNFGSKLLILKTGVIWWWDLTNTKAQHSWLEKNQVIHPKTYDWCVLLVDHIKLIFWTISIVSLSRLNLISYYFLLIFIFFLLKIRIVYHSDDTYKLNFIIYYKGKKQKNYIIKNSLNNNSIIQMSHVVFKLNCPVEYF